MSTCVLSRSKEIIILLICLHVTLAQWSSSGESQSFNCVTPRKEGPIYWELENEPKNKTLFVCSIYNINNCDPFMSNVLDNYSARNMSNSTLTIIVFTIKSVTISQHNTKWFCKEDSREEDMILIKQFDRKVFAPATSPTCDNVTLQNESSIQITCSTEKVFPESICMFYMDINGASEIILNQGFINYKQEQNSTTKYYKTSCTFIGSVNILVPGSLAFRVVMYPNITLTITEEMKRTSEYRNSINLAYPKVILGSDCVVKGYIKENETSNCTCYDNSNSFLPTKLKWSTNQSIILDKGTMIFTAKRKASFQCTISNNFNWTDEIIFQPNISYPPDTVSVSITQHVFDLCKDTNIVVSGICFVSESNPEPSVTININNTLMNITSLKLNREYMFNSPMKNTGIFYISCHANSMEYFKNSSSITTVTIKGPPEFPKMFKNKNEDNKSKAKNLLEISKGDIITCQSQGGYPLLKNISLKCGPEEVHATNQDHVSLALNISNVTNGTCQCVVWHESVCLQNKSTIQFQVIATLIDMSTADQLSNGAIGGIVLAGILVLACIVLIIFIVRRYKEKRLKNSRRKTQNETHDYDHVSGSQYVNTEMHAYETSHIKTSYVNVLHASATSADISTISLEQASKQYLNTEMDPYETADIKKIYSNEDQFNNIVNSNDSHEYDTVNEQAEICFDEITDFNVPIDPGSA